MRIISLLLFLLILPVTLLVSVFLFISSPGAIIFRQERIGLNKRIFVIFKFRTMANGKITFTGKIIRKLGLDEIPQLINIVKAEMAFVGPRPLTEFDIKRLGWDTSENSLRWSVLPGITGPAQLTKICNANLSLQHDLEYAKNKSRKTDFRIFIRSIFVPILGKHTS